MLVPKTGTNSIKAALEERHGKRPLPGHLTASEQERHCYDREMPVDEVWGLVREPIERFLSGANFRYAKSDMTVDDMLDQALKTPPVAVHQRQTFYWDGEKPTRMFPFHRINDMLAELGCGPAPIKNVSRKKWTVRDISHRLEEVRAFLEPDFALWERVAND